MKKWLLIGVLSVLVGVFFAYLYIQFSTPNIVNEEEGRIGGHEQELLESGSGIVQFRNGTKVEVDIASTEPKREKGLSGRESLGEFEGMLFLHDQKARYSYWMKDMKISLDFVWIDDNIIVDITENVPPEDIPKTYYSAAVPVDKVLEVNAGFIKEHLIRVGDKLTITLPEDE